MTLRKKIKAKWNFSLFSKLHKENNKNNKNIFTFLIFYLLLSSFFFLDFTFYEGALCFITFILSLCSNTLTLESIFEYIRQISSREKRVNSKWHFTIDRDDFILGLVSFWGEISRVNTLLTTTSHNEKLPSLKCSYFASAALRLWWQCEITVIIVPK